MRLIELRVARQQESADVMNRALRPIARRPEFADHDAARSVKRGVSARQSRRRSRTPAPLIARWRDLWRARSCGLQIRWTRRPALWHAPFVVTRSAAQAHEASRVQCPRANRWLAACFAVSLRPMRVWLGPAAWFDSFGEREDRHGLNYIQTVERTARRSV
jgi:hypothetical protein